LFFCSVWAGEHLRNDQHSSAADRNAHFNFTGQRATLLASLASRFVPLRCG
jgi:hypothetical protein